MFPIVMSILIATICVVSLIIMKSYDADKIYQDMMWAVIAICFVANIFFNVEYLGKRDAEQKQSEMIQRIVERELTLR